MHSFVEKHHQKITGVISVFDRIILKGYLPISWENAAEMFLARNGVLLKDMSGFTKKQTMLLKAHAQKLAHQSNRPFEYIQKEQRNDDYALRLAHRDGIMEGLVCVISRNETNHSFGMRYGKNRPHLVKNNPRCLTLYFYYMDREFGLMHIRLSTWMPFNIQIYINGHEWLAKRMDAKGIRYTQCDNAFSAIDNCPLAQQLADSLPRVGWEKKLHVFARRVNPLLKTILHGMEYYWVIDQAELATDIMFTDHSLLSELYETWQKHAAVCFQASDIMAFMGRKLHGSFSGTVVTDMKRTARVTRIKHRVRGNWIKMYNKNGVVLRVETVINRPREFRVYKFSPGKRAGDFQQLRKGVTNMAHYARVSARANSAYLNALACVEDPIASLRLLQRVCEPAVKDGVKSRPLNPLRDRDRKLFEAVLKGEHHIHGFKACDIGILLGVRYSSDRVMRRRQCAIVNRKIKLLRRHGLVARCGRAKRYRVTGHGVTIMNAAIVLHHETLPDMMRKAA